MANAWLRLWHDMPNDPKWRTIARKSKQRISDVIAVYLHVLVNASEAGETQCNAGETQGNKEERQSNKTERGKVKDLCADDIASALDLETEQVEQILSAMQGKVMDGDYVTGWDKRQPIREDSSTARVKAFREKQRKKKSAEKAGNETQCNAGETQGNAPDTDTDTDTDIKDIDHGASAEADAPQQSAKNSILKSGLNPESHENSETGLNPDGVTDTARPVDKLDYATVLDVYHELLPDMPAVRILTDSRKKHIRTFWKKYQFDAVRWRAYLTYIATHCRWMLEDRPNGRGGFWKRKNLDYLITERCYVAVKEERANDK